MYTYMCVYTKFRNCKYIFIYRESQTMQGTHGMSKEEWCIATNLFPASQLGVKEYVPAYLGTHLDAQELLTGISFASGGCGYDPLTSQLLVSPCTQLCVSCTLICTRFKFLVLTLLLFQVALSLRHQLNLFKEYKEKLKRVAGEGRAADIIANSLYAVVTGTNDIATTYFLLPFRRAEFDIPSYITFLVQSASSFLQVTDYIYIYI